MPSALVLAKAINFAVQVANSPNLPVNIQTLIQTAIVSAFTGVTGSRPRIGSLLLARSFYAPIIAIGSEVQLISVLLGPASPTLSSFQFGIDQAPTEPAGGGRARVPDLQRAQAGAPGELHHGASRLDQWHGALGPEPCE